MPDTPHTAEADAAAQARRLQEAVENLFACCQTRIALQSEHFALPPASLRALIALGEGRSLPPGELGRRLGVTKSRVTALAADLDKRGLIERRQDPADARVTLINLSEAGERVRQEVRVFMAGLFTAMLDHVEPSRRETVLDALDTLRGCMDAARADVAARDGAPDK